MRSGRLKDTIVISRLTDAVGQDNESLNIWAPFASMRAEIITNDAKAFLAEAGQTVETATVFRVRFRDGIAAGDRVTLDGEDYILTETKEIVRRRVLELRCTS